jgi:hypothetical protein
MTPVLLAPLALGLSAHGVAGFVVADDPEP